MKRAYWLIFGWLLLLPQDLWAFEVTARVDRTTLTPEDSLVLQVIVDGGKARVDLSGLTDFTVASQGTSTQRSYVNGEWEHKVVYQYRLIPNSQGALVIPPLPVTRDGEMQTTREIRIRVARDSQAGDQAGGQASSRNEKLIVRAEVSQPNPVAGQQILYRLKLFVARRIAGASLTAPDFEGFLAKEIEERRKYTHTENGIAYSVTEVQYILTPETPGEKVIQPAVIMAEVLVRSKSRDPFDAFFNDSIFSAGRTKPVRLVSNPVSVNVDPLPAFSGPRPFSGLVGTFTLDAELDRTELPAGESATLTLTLAGTGNLMDAPDPELDLDPDRFKVYEDSPAEDIRLTPAGYAGKKTFKRAIVPVTPGPAKIPSFDMVYFDTDARAYRTLSTRELALSVSGQAAAAPDVQNSPQSTMPLKQDVVVVNKDILDIRRDVAILTPVSRMEFPVFMALVLMPGLVFAGLAVAVRLRGREASPAEQMAAKARACLKQAAGVDPAAPGFLGYLNAGLTAAVLSRGNRKGEALTPAEAGTLLETAGTDAETVQAVQNMLETLDAARFGGQDAGRDGPDLLARTKKLIQNLGLAICCFWVLAAVPDIGRAQDTSGLFIDGIAQYQAGEFEAAAATFEAIAGSGVRNPGLFYNIGNAYLKSRDLGRAILWYERARRLAPLDPDLLFNLEHANSLRRDQVASQVSLLDVFFFWYGRVPLKWLQVSAIAASCLLFLAAGIYLVRKQPMVNGWTRGLAGLMILLTIAAGLQYYRESAVSHAVIIGETVPVMSGTSPAATRLFDLHAGTKVRVRSTMNGYLKIMLTKEKVGWVRQGDAITI